MADDLERSDDKRRATPSEDALHPATGRQEDGTIEDVQEFKYDESQKLGIVGSVFLILNKMIGTGSEFLVVCRTGENCAGHRELLLTVLAG